MSTKLAAAALAMGALSFVHFFGIEKAALAVTFGVIALKDPSITPRGSKLAKTAIISGLAYLLLITSVFLYHIPALSSLAGKLAK
ncbi:MAG: hypothetical protein COX65_00515 [Elusimicrobia bacterium CG_4_10_14_0_2_um_filter_56_8]|nr:MAG: hypothetical protein AUJ51_11340 [Elusimicrobia bacterium CG1_02_56_21]PJA17779.1 MAG: hypothetical protein COX65_00515 [Elusimicrobia bacterium CG_4_10_14_0_2_um_filter_56_8]